MTLPYRLAAIDLDDTLLGQDKQISVENADAVRRLREAGVHCVLASGRHHGNMLRFHQQLNLHGPLVSCNGAQVKVAETGEVWHEVLLPPTLAQEVIELGDSLGLTQNYYHTDGRQYVRQKTRWTHLYERRTENFVTEIGPLETIHGHAALKILWIEAPERIAALLPEMQAHFADRLHITVTDPEYLEFMALGVNKASGLANVAERFGIARSEVVAFGDGNNDVEMLEWAGLGIAMSHARPAAKAAADRVAPDGSHETAFARAATLL